MMKSSAAWKGMMTELNRLMEEANLSEARQLDIERARDAAEDAVALAPLIQILRAEIDAQTNNQRRQEIMDSEVGLR